MWDLSAAFDTLDPDIMCKKLSAYGFDKLLRQFSEMAAKQNSTSGGAAADAALSDVTPIFKTPAPDGPFRDEIEDFCPL